MYCWSTGCCDVLCFQFLILNKQSLPENHTLNTLQCHGMPPARHRSLSSPLGTQNTSTTHWRAPISSLSSGPQLYSHAGKSTLVKKKRKEIYIFINLSINFRHQFEIQSYGETICSSCWRQTRWNPLIINDRSSIYIHFKMNSWRYIFHYCHGDSITYSFFAVVWKDTFIKSCKFY